MRNVNRDLIPALLSATNHNASKNEGLWSLCSWITCKLVSLELGVGSRKSKTPYVFEFSKLFSRLKIFCSTKNLLKWSSKSIVPMKY